MFFRRTCRAACASANTTSKFGFFDISHTLPLINTDIKIAYSL
jgi:hypothetical protein